MNRVDLQGNVGVMSDRALEVDVTLFWSKAGDRNALAQKSLPLGTSILIGEDAGCHFAVPASVLGTSSHVLVSSAGGTVTVTPPANASVFADRMPRIAEPFTLAPGHRADITIGDFTVSLGVSESEARIPVQAGRVIEESALATIAGSGLAHAALLATFAFFMPSLSQADMDTVNRDQVIAMKQYMTNAAERELDAQKVEAGKDEGQPADQLAGQRAKDAEGAAGQNTPTPTQGHWSAKGDSQPQDVKLAKEHALSEAADFGMIGLLNSAAMSDTKAPVVPWGTILAGADKDSHMGNLWAGDIGDAFGSGLGLSGNEQGGGGKGEGIGVTDVGGIYGRMGQCTGANCGDGHGHSTGKVPGNHVPTGPTMRQPPTVETNGRLPGDVIQRIVRQNQGRMLNCYQQGLAKNPGLQGRVQVAFVIGRDGAVSTAQDTAGSDLPDNAVRQCVVRSFLNISFPEPKGGTVNVTYPFTFTPGE